MKSTFALSILVLIPLSARAQLYWAEHFDSPDWQKNYVMSYASNFSYATSGCHSGGCMQIKVNKGDHYGGEAKWMCKNHLGFEPEEMYADYWIMYDSSMNDYWGKSPGFSGTYDVAGWGCNQGTGGTKGWSARTQVHNDNGGVHTNWYLYQTQNVHGCGDEIGWNHTLKFNKWNHLREYIKLNTVGKSDGILKAWVNDTLVGTSNDRDFRTVPNLKIWCYWIDFYYGGTPTSPTDGYARIDDLKLYGPDTTANALEGMHPDGETKVHIYLDGGNQLTIDGLTGFSKIGVYSLDGRLIETRRANGAGYGKMSIGLKAGVYIVKAYAREGSYSTKIIMH